MKTLSLALLLALAAPVLPAVASPAPAAFQIADYDASVEESLAEGQKAMEDGNYEQALSSFQDALSTYPDDKKIKALVKEAQAKACEHYLADAAEQVHQKDYNGAIQTYDNALDLDPENAAAKKGRLAAENWPKADNYIKEAKARAAKGDYDYAVAYFQKAFDLVGDPEVKTWLDEAKAHKKK